MYVHEVFEWAVLPRLITRLQLASLPRKLYHSLPWISSLIVRLAQTSPLSNFYGFYTAVTIITDNGFVNTLRNETHKKCPKKAAFQRAAAKYQSVKKNC
jgi:hypothetical protein